MMQCAPEMVRPTQQPWEAVVPADTFGNKMECAREGLTYQIAAPGTVRLWSHSSGGE